MQLTQHARVRSAQRSIPATVIETIFAYGKELPAPGQAVRIMLDETSISLAADGDTRKRSELERFRDTYLIVSETGQIVTIARRHRRFFN